MHIGTGHTVTSLGPFNCTTYNQPHNGSGFFLGSIWSCRTFDIFSVVGVALEVAPSQLRNIGMMSLHPTARHRSICGWRGKWAAPAYIGALLALSESTGRWRRLAWTGVGINLFLCLTVLIHARSSSTTQKTHFIVSMVAVFWESLSQAGARIQCGPLGIKRPHGLDFMDKCPHLFYRSRGVSINLEFWSNKIPKTVCLSDHFASVQMLRLNHTAMRQTILAELCHSLRANAPRNSTKYKHGRSIHFIKTLS